MALHALNNSITFGLVKDLDPALFAGVVVAQRRHRRRRRHRVLRPRRGGRMRRPALALLRCALALPAQAAAQTPPPAHAAPPPAPPPCDALAHRPGHARRQAPGGVQRPPFTARVVMKPFVANETVGAAGLPRREEDQGQDADVQAGRRRHGGRRDAQGELQARRPADDQGLAQATPRSRRCGAKTMRSTSCAPTRARARRSRGPAPAVQARRAALRRAAQRASTTPARAAR